MTGAEVVLSILSAVVVSLLGIIAGLVIRSQNKFEERMEKHVHHLREDLQSAMSQLTVLRTLVALQLTDEQRTKVDHILEPRRS